MKREMPFISGALALGAAACFALAFATAGQAGAAEVSRSAATQPAPIVMAANTQTTKARRSGQAAKPVRSARRAPADPVRTTGRAAGNVARSTGQAAGTVARETGRAAGDVFRGIGEGFRKTFGIR